MGASARAVRIKSGPVLSPLTRRCAELPILVAVALASACLAGDPAQHREGTLEDVPRTTATTHQQLAGLVLDGSRGSLYAITRGGRLFTGSLRTARPSEEGRLDLADATLLADLSVWLEGSPVIDLDLYTKEGVRRLFVTAQNGAVLAIEQNEVVMAIAPARGRAVGFDVIDHNGGHLFFDSGRVIYAGTGSGVAGVTTATYLAFH